jgi:hypothetical protein
MITREDCIQQSVFNYARDALVARGYPDDKVRLLEAWEGQLSGDLDRNYVAFGFDFDDEGRQAELGSDLKVRLYTIQALVFGQSHTLARNIANALKFALEVDGTIPLLDISQPGLPEIDRLTVDGVSAERQAMADPEPWQRFLYTTTVRLEDFYPAALV